ncbi:DUF932 domain-containing protein [Kibdelosporangium lantanae]|uniref:DUF932 domain-containing protein n=1 Tax=Kibdelosporangium lantanae TaxID=1497396 RepID=A0ABW3M264_9PSEU
MTQAVKPAPKRQAKTQDVVKPRDSWVRMATAVNSSRTVNDLLTRAGLKGWDVRPEPVFALVPTPACTECEQPVGKKHKQGCFIGTPDEGEEYDGLVSKDDTAVHVELPRSWGLVRNNPLTGQPEGIATCRREFRPIPIEDRASILTEIVKQTGAKFGPAGPLWDNEGAFASVVLPDSVKVNRVDELAVRLVLVTALAPGRKSFVLVQPLRAASGTLQFFGGDDRLELSDEDSADLRLTEAGQAQDLAVRYGEWIAGEAAELQRAKMTDNQFHTVLNEVWPYPGDGAPAIVRETYTVRRELAKTMFEGKVDLFAKIKGTRWGALQAVWTANEHAFTAKTQDDEALRRDRAERVALGKGPSDAVHKVAKAAFELIKGA